MTRSAKSPGHAGAAPKRKRLSPDDRRDDIVAKATTFFADEGFGGGTRELARRLGVTQPLLYRYFPSKDDLIREVYRTVYLEPLDSGWDGLLSDRTRTMRDRLQDFYDRYTEVIFTRQWLRIFFYAGLSGLDLNRSYLGVIGDKILTLVIAECRAEAGLAAQRAPTAAEMELGWILHGSIVYYGIRKQIYGSPVAEDRRQTISRAVELFLAGFAGLPASQDDGTAVAKRERPKRDML